MPTPSKEFCLVCRRKRAVIEITNGSILSGILSIVVFCSRTCYVEWEAVHPFIPTEGEKWLMNNRSILKFRMQQWDKLDNAGFNRTEQVPAKPKRNRSDRIRRRRKLRNIQN